MGALSDLIFGIRAVFFDGAEMPLRGTLEFEGSGLTVTDDAIAKRTKIAVQPSALVAGVSGAAVIDAARVVIDGDDKTKVDVILGNVATADDTPSPVVLFTSSGDDVVNVIATVTVRGADASDYGRWLVNGLAVRTGGVLDWHGGAPVADPAPQRSDVGLDATLSISGDNVRLTLTGLAATNLRWGWDVRVQRQVF